MSFVQVALLIGIDVETLPEVFPLDVASVVAQRNAIGIQDGQDPNFEVISELVHKSVLRQQVVQGPVNDVTGVSF